MILEHLREQARRAHYGTSFSPEKRGDYYIQIYSAELQADIDNIRTAAAEYGKDAEDTIARYRERYERHFSAWLSSKSNCISSMITGPARFPVRRAEKLNNWERNKSDFFRNWRDKCLKAIIRGFKPRVTADTELEKARGDLAACEARQEMMKAANAVIRKSKGVDCRDQLQQLGIREKLIVDILTPDWAKRIGFKPYELTNNNANIRRLRLRVIELEEKAAKRNGGANSEIEINGARIVENYEADRVQIHFPGKPSREVIQGLKSNGWKWSPTGSCWQRKLTGQALFDAKRIIPSPQ